MPTPPLVCQILQVQENDLLTEAPQNQPANLVGGCAKLLDLTIKTWDKGITIFRINQELNKKSGEIRQAIQDYRNGRMSPYAPARVLVQGRKMSPPTYARRVPSLI